MGEVKVRPVYAVDFDGTLCRSRWPGIGEPNVELISWLKKEKERGCYLVLWTMREEQALEEAIAWCRGYGLEFDAVNDNLPHHKAQYGNNPRKVYADIYFDDHNSKMDLWRNTPSLTIKHL